MKRRVLLVRTLTTSASGVVFTAVGWLMGTKTLTMSTSQPPPTPCSSGIVVEQAAKKCVGPNCPSVTGECGQDCWKFWCPEGYYWVCKINNYWACCSDADCTL